MSSSSGITGRSGGGTCESGADSLRASMAGRFLSRARGYTANVFGSVYFILKESSNVAEIVVVLPG
jgi:hypothetical protein